MFYNTIIWQSLLFLDDIRGIKYAFYRCQGDFISTEWNEYLQGMHTWMYLL